MDNFENPNQRQEQPGVHRSNFDMDFYQEMLHGDLGFEAQDIIEGVTFVEAPFGFVGKDVAATDSHDVGVGRLHHVHPPAPTTRHRARPHIRRADAADLRLVLPLPARLRNADYQRRGRRGRRAATAMDVTGGHQRAIRRHAATGRGTGHFRAASDLSAALGGRPEDRGDAARVLCDHGPGLLAGL